MLKAPWMCVGTKKSVPSAASAKRPVGIGAIEIHGDKLTMDASKCNYCGRCVKACPFDAWIGESAYIVTFGGLFGNTIAKGDEILPLVRSEEQLYRVTDATIQFFADHAKAGERFKFTLDRVGRDVFKKVVREAYDGKVEE